MRCRLALAAARGRGEDFDTAWPEVLDATADEKWRDALDATAGSWWAAYVGEPDDLAGKCATLADLLAVLDGAP